MVISENQKGAMLILVGMLILAIVDNYVRFVAQDIGLWQFHLMRSVVSVALIYFYAVSVRRKLKPKNLRAVLLRTSFLVLAMFIYFGSLAFLPISQVAAGFFTSPIFVMVFSILFWREKIHFYRLIAIVCGSIGVVLVLGIYLNHITWLYFIPVLAGMFYAMSSILLRNWCSEEDAVSIMLIFFLGMGIVGLFMICLLEVNTFFNIYQIPESFLTANLKLPSINTIFIIFVHALGSILGGVLITLGYQKGETSFVSIFEYSFLFFATTWAYLFFGELITLTIFIGMLLIFGSGYLLSLRGREPS